MTATKQRRSRFPSTLFYLSWNSRGWKYLNDIILISVRAYVQIEYYSWSGRCSIVFPRWFVQRKAPLKCAKMHAKKQNKKHETKRKRKEGPFFTSTGVHSRVLYILYMAARSVSFNSSRNCKFRGSNLHLFWIKMSARNFYEYCHNNTGRRSTFAERAKTNLQWNTECYRGSSQITMESNRAVNNV